MGAGDSVKFRVTDGTPPDYYSRWNKVWDYEELFCERYFLDSVYTDAAVMMAQPTQPMTMPRSVSCPLTESILFSFAYIRFPSRFRKSGY